jgi:hypothetical protein
MKFYRKFYSCCFRHEAGLEAAKTNAVSDAGRTSGFYFKLKI